MYCLQAVSSDIAFELAELSLVSTFITMFQVPVHFKLQDDLWNFISQNFMVPTQIYLNCFHLLFLYSHFLWLEKQEFKSP